MTQLKRSGDSVTIRFKLINEDDKSISVGHTFGEPTISGDYGSVGGVHLLDGKGKKKYLVMRDDKKTCVCSRGVKDVEPKASVLLWARFPAPPEDVEKVTVVVPKFLPIDDVPIAK